MPKPKPKATPAKTAPVEKKKSKNLQPAWKPGQSGNPGGRPKRRPITDCYLALADQKLPAKLCKDLELKKGSTYAQALARAQFIQAISGKVKNATEIREAIEGRATQRIELAESDTGPIKIIVEYAPKPDES